MPAKERMKQSEYVVLVEIVDARLVEIGNRSVAMPRKATSPTDIVISNARLRIDDRYIEASVTAIEVFKGKIPSGKLQFSDWTFQPQVTVGATYLVYGDGPRVSLDCGESKIIYAGNPEHARVLEQLRSLAR
jgi:hypothetical protein